MEIHPSNRNEVAWTSWLPALGYALGASTGPVLEIGVGHFSTPFLHEYCHAAGRALYSLETDRDWYLNFARYDWMKSDRKHYVFHCPADLGSARGVKGFSSLMESRDDPVRFGAALIDSSPGGEARLAPFLAFIDHSDFVVVHDYHRENEEAIAPHLHGVSYKVYRDYDPPTLLASKKFKL